MQRAGKYEPWRKGNKKTLGGGRSGIAERKQSGIKRQTLIKLTILIKTWKSGKGNRLEWERRVQGSGNFSVPTHPYPLPHLLFRVKCSKLHSGVNLWHTS